MTAAERGPDTVTEFTVGTAARRLGIPVATLRSWNQRYGLGPQQHLPGRHRYYTVADLAVLSRMVELVRAGATPASAAQAARVLLTPAPEPGALGPVLAATERMDVTRLLDLLSAHLTHHGVTATWNTLCRPAFAHIVTRQDAGEGYIDVEHLLSWALTTSLHRCVPRLAEPAGAGSLVLACAPGERHVLPLEVLRAALAEQGRAALLLGADVPATALAQSLSRRGAHAGVVLWSQTPATAHPEAATAAGPGPVWLAGPGWNHSHAASGRQVLNSLEEAVTALTGPA